LTQLWHLALLGVAVSLLAAAALRCSCRISDSLDARVLGAIPIAAAFAITEALVLGLADQGANPFELTAAAGLTWVATRTAVAGPTLAVRDQLAATWTNATPFSQATIGGFGLLVLGVAGFAMWHPTYGVDGVSYHVAQPAIWIHDGRPGSGQQTLLDFPTAAYPKSLEVLLFWGLAISRTAVTAIPLTVSMATLAVICLLVALRRLEVSTPIAMLATASSLLVPWDVLETSGVWTDLAGLAWLSCCIALCVITRDEPGALGPALVAAALAVGTKTTTVPFALGAIGWALWTNRSWLRHHLVRFAMFGVPALGLGSVWYVANWIVYGAPLWPFSRVPAGPPQPRIFAAYGARFIADPIHAARLAGPSVLLDGFGGGLVLVAGVVLIAIASLLPSQRPARRIVVVGTATVLLDVLLWATAAFTGVTHGSAFLVFVGLRYLTFAPVAAAAMFALICRRPSAIRAVALVLMAAATGVNLWEIHQDDLLRYPVKPPLVFCAALGCIGVLVGLLAGRARAAPHVMQLRALAPAVTIGIGLALAAPASSYLRHYVQVERRVYSTDAPAIEFLSRQPGWVHGDAPVAAGLEAYASLAGPDFTHPLSFIPANEPCTAVRAAASRGWVVLETNPVTSFHTRYEAPLACLQGIRPAARLRNHVTIYAPERLLARHPPIRPIAVSRHSAIQAGWAKTQVR
jgi:hypothetical protein